VLDRDPLGAPAINRLNALRARMPALLRQAGLPASTRVVYGGETALAGETVDRVMSDLWRVGLVALLVNLVLLALFTRAIVAPLYLVGASVLGLAAALGLTTFVFQEVLGYDDLTYYVPFAAAVLLVALGSDYNVFIAGSIWQKARTMRLREAIAVAAPEAAKAIRVAGVALAASFALLAIVPVRSFREFAFVMAAGVLIDTFIVRSLLVPALTSLFGEKAWWPGRRVKRLSAHDFVDRVGGRAGIEHERAARATEATLATLSERITRREAKVLAAHLPESLQDALDHADGGPERFGADEFVRRVSDREGVSGADALEHARAVLSTLDEVVAGDLATSAQLSPTTSRCSGGACGASATAPRAHGRRLLTAQPAPGKIRARGRDEAPDLEHDDVALRPRAAGSRRGRPPHTRAHGRGNRSAPAERHPPVAEQVAQRGVRAGRTSTIPVGRGHDRSGSARSTRPSHRPELRAPIPAGIDDRSWANSRGAPRSGAGPARSRAEPIRRRGRVARSRPTGGSPGPARRQPPAPDDGPGVPPPQPRSAAARRAGGAHAGDDNGRRARGRA
jgi:uncharacterized protein (DUF2267 family)